MAILSSPCAGKLRGALQALCLALAMLAPGRAPAQEPAKEPAQEPAQQPDTYPGMPPIPDRNNVYSEIGAEHLSAAVEGALARVYVPHVTSNDVYVIDPATLKVVDRFPVGLHAAARRAVIGPQDAVGHQRGRPQDATAASRRSIRPPASRAHRSGSTIPTTSTSRLTAGFAIVVAEAAPAPRLPRSAHDGAANSRCRRPQCGGINHADFSIDGRYAIFTCEFSGALVKIDMVDRTVLGYLKLSGGGMPQDIRISPEGEFSTSPTCMPTASS